MAFTTVSFPDFTFYIGFAWCYQWKKFNSSIKYNELKWIASPFSAFRTMKQLFAFSFSQFQHVIWKFFNFNYRFWSSNSAIKMLLWRKSFYVCAPAGNAFPRIWKFKRTISQRALTKYVNSTYALSYVFMSVLLIIENSVNVPTSSYNSTLMTSFKRIYSNFELTWVGRTMRATHIMMTM